MSDRLFEAAGLQAEHAEVVQGINRRRRFPEDASIQRGGGIEVTASVQFNRLIELLLLFWLEAHIARRAPSLDLVKRLVECRDKVFGIFKAH